MPTSKLISDSIGWESYRRLFVSLLMAVVVFIVTLSWLTWRSLVAEKTLALHSEELLFPVFGAAVLREKVDLLVSDARFIKVGFRDFGTHDHLDETMTEFMKSRGVYDQFRLLDASGQEQVRYNFREGDVEKVPPSQLQSKRDRYYFQEGLRLEHNQYYISALDLNVEGGVVERPLKPVLRVVLKAGASSYAPVSIVVLNYLGADLLDALKEVERSEEQTRSVVVDQDGYYVMGEAPSQEWGGSLPDRKAENLRLQKPLTWKAMQETTLRSQCLRNEEGIACFTRFSPTHLPLNRGGDVVFSNQQLYFISFLDADEFAQQVLQEFVPLFGIYCLFGLALLYASWKFARLKALKLRNEAFLQEEMYHKEKLHSLGRMATGMAHEINTPLAHISLSLELIRQRVLPREKLLQTTAKAQESCSRVAAIIDHVRTFGRMDEQVRTAFELPVTFNNALSLIRHRLLNEGVSVQESWPDGLPRVEGNPGQTEQVLLNLLNNALDAMEGESNRFLLVAVTVQPLTTGAAQVEMRLTDNGPGVPKQQQGQLFDPFFTTKELGKGTGLGLSIAYNLMREQGGGVAYEDGERGATFRIWLPASEAT